MNAALPEPLAGLPPVFVAPMAGGPGTPRLLGAAWRTRHFGQLAAGYRTADALRDEIAAVRAGGTPVFGVNVFVPNPAATAADAYDRYRALLEPEAAGLGVTLPPLRDDDDGWHAKTDLLLAEPVPVVSFTFGLPPSGLVARLRRSGTITVQTVTDADEARAAVELGIDALAVQGFAAGGHSGVLDPARVPRGVPLVELVASIRAAVPVPIVAAGGITTRDEVRAVLDAGAAAVSVGTAVLRSTESGASAVHKNALADERFTETVLTRAFTGRIARALRNRFVDEYGAAAPVGYPAVHHLTRPLRAAAAAAGDPSAVNLWAGTGYRSARDLPVRDILDALTP